MKAVLRAAGTQAVLVEVEGLEAVQALDHAVHTHLADDPAVVDIVPATRTVLVTVTAAAHLARVRAVVHAVALDTEPTPPEAGAGRTVTLPVHYDGPDLADVAAMTGLTEREVIDAHTGTPWQCAFVGFAPGFPYLVGGDPRLEVARRAEPRTQVPTGAVGLAGTFSGVYPRVSPGGWQLLGHTDEQMWDLDRTPPALVAPGDTVHCVEAGAPQPSSTDGSDGVAVPPAPAVPPMPPTSPDQHVRTLEVLATGPSTIFVDAGRPGLARLGVSASGAADRGAYTLGQRLLETDVDADRGSGADGAALEVTFGGLRLRAEAVLNMVVTGAPAQPRVDGVEVGMNAPFYLMPGQELALGTPTAGLRSYVAVRGGFTPEPVLGSRSTDVLSGIGPAPLAVGDRVRAGSPRSLHFAGVDVAPVPPLDNDGVVVDVIPGPRDEWFTSLHGPSGLAGRDWKVSPRSNRVGIRLEGAPVERAPEFAGELPTEGVVRGAIQVPANGEPVVFLADHPVTGGYPVIGVVVPEHLDRLAQAVPGSTVRFRIHR